MILVILMILVIASQSITERPLFIHARIQDGWRLHQASGIRHDQVGTQHTQHTQQPLYLYIPHQHSNQPTNYLSLSISTQNSHLHGVCCVPMDVEGFSRVRDCRQQHRLQEHEQDHSQDGCLSVWRTRGARCVSGYLVPWYGYPPTTPTTTTTPTPSLASP